MASSKKFFTANEALASVLDQMSDEIYGESDDDGGSESSDKVIAADVVMEESDEEMDGTLTISTSRSTSMG